MEEHGGYGYERWKLRKAVVAGHEQLTYPNLPRSLFQTLRTTASRFPDKTALYEEGGDQIVFHQFLRRVEVFSASLALDYGLKKGDICGILCVNSIDFCVAFYAVIRLGAVALPLSTKFKSHDLQYPLTHSGARVLILDPQWMEQVEPIREKTDLRHFIFTGPESILRANTGQIVPAEKVELEDGALIMYTSGTTGRPKSVQLTHFNVLHAIESYRRILGLDETDSTIISIPIFNVTGLVALLSLFVYIGGSIHLLPRFDGERMVRTIQQAGLTFVHGSPTIFIKMLEQKDKFPRLPTLKKGACGSSNLPMDVLRRLHEWVPGFCMHTVFGMTETSSPATIMPDDPLRIHKPGSSGLPIPGVEIKIWDDAAGRPAASGHSGTLLVRGSTVIHSYWGSGGKGQEAFQDGWLDTGDIGRVDEDGFLYLLDRKKDMINRGGEKVYSIEVENVLAEHPAVAECAVIGKQDPVFGETVCAAVQLLPNSNCDEQELKTYMYGKLATYKLPGSYVFLAALPKNENGKINKNMLRAQLNQRPEDFA